MSVEIPHEQLECSVDSILPQVEQSKTKEKNNNHTHTSHVLINRKKRDEILTNCVLCLLLVKDHMLDGEFFSSSSNFISRPSVSLRVDLGV